MRIPTIVLQFRFSRDFWNKRPEAIQLALRTEEALRETAYYDELKELAHEIVEAERRGPAALLKFSITGARRCYAISKRYEHIRERLLREHYDAAA